jgi:hypothetical protein
MKIEFIYANNATRLLYGLQAKIYYIFMFANISHPMLKLQPVLVGNFLTGRVSSYCYYPEQCT